MIRYISQFMRGDMEFLELVILVGSICFVVFCATPLHEFAHAFVAVKLGDDTPRLRGRLTINPMAHIDWIGAIMIFLFGFGYAKPVEVRMRHFKKPKRDMAIVALAGPACNLLQSFIFLFLRAVCTFGAYKLQNEAMAYMGIFFLYAAAININLGVFNLLPIPPLDGSRLLTALLPSKYYYKIMQYERYIMIGLFVLLFTGILTTPLSFLSSLILGLFSNITQIPFEMMMR
ncbi:MAG: site-2 protease family protein [Clostridia bacterium]|nr:site-2 protease family protein [Clostridia bacterium]MBP3559070.1 site-2 protease family protein [Clostridia bacterium]